MTANLLETKFYVPPLPANWVRRPQLIRLLQEGLALNRQITLVSAPAGFGKTTCVIDWLHTLPDHPVVWLSLDRADDDPGRFFAYLITALHTALPALGDDVAALLRSGQLPPGEIITTTLVNAIAALPDRFLLILDDFHVIQDRDILGVLEALLTNQPPPLHLVLVTREDPPLPLARFRANNLLTEIRAKDLCFTGGDIDRFLNEMMGLALAPGDIAALQARTEGWIAGLQLAGLSIREQADPVHFIANLSGSHRAILSYLTEQVLNQQPADIQRFLLQSAILDRLNGDLCQAVTGRADSPDLLERLFNANLFLIPLDDERQWYRYHYLFADLLRDRQTTLPQAEVADLHRSASRWYSAAGMAGEAIQHALAAPDYPLAVALLEDAALEMVMQGYAKTVHGWVQAIPAEWRTQSPRTILAFTWMHMLRGDYAGLASYLERLRAILDDDAAPALKTEWLAIRSLLAMRDGQPEESLTLANQSIMCAPEGDSWALGLAYYVLASAYPVAEAYENVVDAYQIALHHSRAANNRVVELLSISCLAVLAFEHGQLHLAYEIAAPAHHRLARSGSPPPISTVIFGMLGEVYLQWHQLEAARQNIQRAFQFSSLGGYQSGIIGCRILLARLAQLEGDLPAAAREMQAVGELIQVDTPDYVRQEAAAQQVRVYLRQGRIAAAELALQGLGFSFQGRFTYPALPADQSITYSAGLLYAAGLHVLLTHAQAGRGSSDLGAGLALADQLISRTQRAQYVLVLLEALLLRAQLHALLGDHSASRADYGQALQLAEPEGFVAVFAEAGPVAAAGLASLLADVSPDYAERLRCVLPAARPDSTGATPTAPGLVDALTDRELDVLRLMAEGLKYKEIAAELFISLNTVRFHVKTIYGKLHVNTRAQAVAAARRQRLL